MPCFKRKGKPYLVVLFVFVLLEILLCGGIVFGWASIVVVFKAKHFYFDKCEISLENNSFSFTDVPALKSMLTANLVNTTLDCSRQNDRLNLVFTITMSLFSAVQFPTGIFIDKFGPRVTRMIGGSIYVMGCLGLAFITLGNEDFLFPTFIAIALGGIILSMTVYKISNTILWKRRAIVMCSVNGGFDSSAVVLLVFKLLYDAGVELSSIMYFYTGLSSLLIAFGTVFLIPSQSSLKKWSTEEELDGLHFSLNDTISLKQSVTASKTNSAFERSNSIKSIHSSVASQEMYNLPHVEDGEDLRSNPYKLPDKNTNQASVSVLQSIFTPLYLIELVCLMGIHLRLLCYVGSLQQNLEKLTQNDLTKVSKYINIFGYIQFSGIIITPFIGLTFRRLKKVDKKQLKKEEIYVHDLRSSIAPYCITNILGMTFCIFDLIDSMKLQIPSYILCTVVRGFLYANHATFIGIAFPTSQFATLLGLSHLMAGLFGALQYAFFRLTNHTFEGNSFWSSLILLILVSFGNVYPIYVWWICRKKESTFKKSPPTATILCS